MRNSIILILFYLSGMLSVQGQDEQIIIGSKHDIYSDTLNEERSFWVNLPELYNEDGSSYKRYPVLFILDGSAHFRSISGMVNYMSSGYNGNRRIPEMIVVAIENVNRRRDFTPDKIITRRANVSGGGERFLAFLENELIPLIDKNYRTSPYRMLYGHSLGGLLATHAYMKDKTLFNSIIAVDPSFGTWDADTMDKKITGVTENTFNRFIYIATANWGKRNFKNRDRHIRLYESLNSKCNGQFPAELEYFENENHGSVPAIAFHNGISSIFNGYGISYRDIEDKEHLVRHFESISQRLSTAILPPEALVNRVAYRLLRDKDATAKSNALDLFMFNTELYPNSYNAYDSLGEAYEVMDDKNNAIKYYKKSLELYSKNEHARRKIESLEQGVNIQT